MNHRRPRGFVLLVAVIVVIVVTTIVGILVQSVGEGRIATVHTTDGGLARGIAQAGMARMTGILLSNGTRDFDKFLDPATQTAVNSSECTCNLSSVSTGGNYGVPTLTDTGNQVVTFQGEKWRLVPYNGGAYMLRLEDDSDDIQINNEWADYTGNTGGTLDSNSNGTPDSKDATSTSCAREGPSGGGSTNGALTGQLDNPCRDRDRTIWVVAMGIYPGTDPAKASHRAVLRKLHSARQPSVVTGVTVRGNVAVSGNGSMKVCSPIGSVIADGAFTRSGSGQACACGDSTARAISGWQHCTDTTMCSTLSPPVECADGDLQVDPTVSVAALGSFFDDTPTAADGYPSGTAAANSAAGTDFYVDWSRPCVFLIDPKFNLWFWDASASRGPAASPACSSLEGRGFGKPWPPDPSKIGSATSTSASDWAGCWTPLALDLTAGSAAPVVAKQTATASPSGTVDETGSRAWLPTTSAWRYSGGAIDTIMCGAGNKHWSVTGGTGSCRNDSSATGNSSEYDGPTAGAATYNKPNWGLCSVTYPPFPVPGQTQQNLSCASPADATSGVRCDGTNVALKGDNAAGGAVWFGPMNAGSAAQTKANLEAVPAGVYIFDYPVSLTGSGFDFDQTAQSTNNASKVPMVNFMLATVMVNGTLDLNVNFWTGFGQGFGNPNSDPALAGGSRFASVITDKQFTMRGGADYRLGGSIYSVDDTNWNGGGQCNLFGELYSNDTFNIGGTGDFVWRYENAFRKPPPPNSGPPTVYLNGE